MATFNKFYSHIEYLCEGVHNLGSDTLKVALSNVAPVATDATLSDISEIAPGNGYSAGGATVTTSGSAQTLGVYKLTLEDVSITAVGGAIGPFRYVILYNDTPTSPADPLIGWFDFGVETTVLGGSTFTVDFDAVGGALTLV